MAIEQEQTRDQDSVRALEVSIRLAVVAGMVVWCFEILRPFLSTIIWALIIAAALYPAYRWLLERFQKSAGMDQPGPKSCGSAKAWR